MSKDATFGLRLDLRRWALQRWMRDTDLYILDIGAGEGNLWRTLQDEYRTSQYVPVDKKPVMPGTLPIEVTAAWLYANPMTRYNVVDCDTFGEPWEIFLTLAMVVKQPTLLFVTAGGGANKKAQGLSNQLRQVIGMPMDDKWKGCPNSPQVTEYAAELCVQKAAHTAKSPGPILSFTPLRGIRGYAMMTGAK